MDDETYAGAIVETEALYELTSAAEAYLASGPTEFAAEPVHG